MWGSTQESAFTTVKQELTTPTVLRLYDPNAETKISADAFSYGLGAVLLQRNNVTDSWKPVAYSSGTLSESECHYPQIEKEALASTWVCEKFEDYILGKRIRIETDHKPLGKRWGQICCTSMELPISRYPEITKLSSTTSSSKLPSFSRLGIPETLISNNGSQYASGVMKDFAKSYGFEHITSNPHFPQGNALAEQTVKTIKGLLKKSSDPYLALLAYRATPFPWCGYSPAELMMV